VNAVLQDANAFGDHVLLRRELVDHKLVARKSDCSEYWKLPARPDAETRTLLAAWRARRKTKRTAAGAGQGRNSACSASRSRSTASPPARIRTCRIRSECAAPS